MAEPVYSIKLFYGDMKFTNDYSNVLHFNTKELRDSYFDGFNDSFEVINTETNRVMFDGGSVRLLIDSNQLGNLDKINYCYINYALVDGNTFEQYRKYYFINSYEIVSSNENLTVVEFVLEYDVWQNNQFDFTFRESNIERMHVDRWEKNSNNIKYTRPILDAIESNTKVDKIYQIESDTYANVKHHGSLKYSKIIWVMVTALHTFGEEVDQMLYHFIPVIYNPDDLTFNVSDPTIGDYYYQNSIVVGDVTDGNDHYYLYFPSLQSLDSAYLSYACGNRTNDDTVKILNVQFFNWLPLKIVYENSHFGDVSLNMAVVKTDNDIKLEPYGGSPRLLSLSYMITYAVADLSIFGELGNQLIKEYSYSEFSKPTKPSDNDVYDSSHEPALYMSPIRKKYLSMGDISALTEIPDIIYIKNMCNKISPSLNLTERISYSSISAYCYFTFDDNRVLSNTEGFALVKPSFLGDIISDSWVDYCVTQRDSDRAMMWTNIATGGISEMGSTVVSAGIGWRSNMERAYSLSNSEKFAKSQQRYYNNTPGAGHSERSQFYKNLRSKQLTPNIKMYSGMARNAMMMSGIGGVTAFSANAIHQAMAQRTKERSIQNTPGTLAKAGNAIGAIVDNQFKLYYVETVVDDTSFEKYKILFMKYGYYIGGVELPIINSRKYYNYIKTNGAILTGRCNNLILSYLASIFDNGVTIWHMDYCNYSSIYDYRMENIERSLI